MADVETSRFTVGVFQDVTWAERGLEALRKHSFPNEALSLIAKDTAETAALAQRFFGGGPARMNVAGVGAVIATGSLIDALDGSARDLGRVGLAAAFKRVGFQAHDGQIFEALTGKGGILVAVQGEARAADALAVLHSFGGANAAIGAWTGRV